MKDRVPENPGRVLITPEDGSSPFYATMTRADNPMQEGDPLNKATLLKDDTAAMFGLPSTAVPDDIFKRSLNMIPSPYGILAFRILDTNGTPRQVAARITPEIVNGSIVYTDSDGWYRGFALPGTYTVEILKNMFVTSVSESQQITVVAGCIRNAASNFSIVFVEHNTVKITESVDEIFVPGDITSLDLFGVGGGASGAVGGGTTAKPLVVAGGGSGYTETILGRNCAKKRLKIEIGAGGEPVNVNYSSNYMKYADGKAGGNTTIKKYEGDQSTTILSANGAPASKAGYSSGMNYYGTGGSCGGGGLSSTSKASQFDGAEDGKSNNGATPQGTTTRAFGEADGELFASGGGGASIEANYAGVGGRGAGAAKKVATSSSSSKTVVGEDATSYGSGGGAALGRASSNVTHSLNATSGAGMQGLVMLRW